MSRRPKSKTTYEIEELWGGRWDFYASFTSKREALRKFKAIRWPEMGLRLLKVTREVIS